MTLVFFNSFMTVALMQRFTQVKYNNYDFSFFNSFMIIALMYLHVMHYHTFFNFLDKIFYLMVAKPTLVFLNRFIIITLMHIHVIHRTREIY